MAQRPDLLILDDYSIGLDAGYRRLFLDDLREYLKDEGRTVFLTSHIIQDMASFVDEVIFLASGGRLLTTSLEEFSRTFRCYRAPRNGSDSPALDKADLSGKGVMKNVEKHPDYWDVFSFADKAAVEQAIRELGWNIQVLEEVPMNLEDAFIGYTGRY